MTSDAKGETDGARSDQEQVMAVLSSREWEERLAAARAAREDALAKRAAQDDAPSSSGAGGAPIAGFAVEMRLEGERAESEAAETAEPEPARFEREVDVSTADAQQVGPAVSENERRPPSAGTPFRQSSDAGRSDLAGELDPIPTPPDPEPVPARPPSGEASGASEPARRRSQEPDRPAPERRPPRAAPRPEPAPAYAYGRRRSRRRGLVLSGLVIVVAAFVGLIVLGVPSEVARQATPEGVLPLNPAPSSSEPAASAPPSEGAVVKGGGGTILTARPAPLDRPPPPSTTPPAPAKPTETPSRDVERLPLVDAPAPPPARQQIAAAPTAGPDEVASNVANRMSPQPTEKELPPVIAADSAPPPPPKESKTAAATTGASEAEPTSSPARDETTVEPTGFQPPDDVSTSAALRRLQNKTPYLPDVRLLLRPGTDGAGGRRAAASAYSTLRQAGFAVEDRRPGSVPPPYTVVRYFDPTDAALAYDIAILLGGAPIDLSGVVEPGDRRIEVFLAE